MAGTVSRTATRSRALATVARGFWPGGPVPFGCKLEPVYADAAKTLKITGLSQSELDQRLAELGEAPGETIGFARGS